MASGYRDDHLHLLACAAAQRSIDVRDASTLDELLAIILHGVRERAARGDRASWLRAWGYDDALLAEKRHPAVAELDAVTQGFPTVLHHITGHVAVANTAAGRALGIGSGALLVERHDVLAGVPRPERAETITQVTAVLADLASVGISACTDATHTNDLSSLGLLADAAAAVPAVSVTAMVGADRLDTLGSLSYGTQVRSRSASASETGGVRVGHAKVMPSAADPGSVDEFVALARARGFPVAVHAMDIDTLQDALDALEAHPPAEPGPALDGAAPGHATPDRIEHCALALPEQLDRIARLGATVVTQPSFVTRRAQKYREQLSATEQDWLWPLASLLRRGIRVTLSSDAPTVPSDPAEWMAAAVRRDLAPAERIDAQTALGLCTV